MPASNLSLSIAASACLSSGVLFLQATILMSLARCTHIPAQASWCCIGCRHLAGRPWQLCLPASSLPLMQPQPNACLRQQPCKLCRLLTPLPLLGSPLWAGSILPWDSGVGREAGGHVMLMTLSSVCTIMRHRACLDASTLRVSKPCAVVHIKLHICIQVLVEASTIYMETSG